VTSPTTSARPWRSSRIVSTRGTTTPPYYRECVHISDEFARAFVPAVEPRAPSCALAGGGQQVWARQGLLRQVTNRRPSANPIPARTRNRHPNPWLPTTTERESFAESRTTESPAPGSASSNHTVANDIKATAGRRHLCQRTPPDNRQQRRRQRHQHDHGDELGSKLGGDQQLASG